jgi:hypothetical protein
MAAPIEATIPRIAVQRSPAKVLCFHPRLLMLIICPLAVKVWVRVLVPERNAVEGQDPIEAAGLGVVHRDLSSSASESKAACLIIYLQLRCQLLDCESRVTWKLWCGDALGIVGNATCKSST